MHHDKATGKAKVVVSTVAVFETPGSYPCTYKNAWLAKQKVIVDLFINWAEALCRENPTTIFLWCFKDELY